MEKISTTVITIAALIAVAYPGIGASQTPARLSLDDARAMARAASQEIIVAREAVEAARGRELQSGAIPNPGLSYSAERTSGAGQSNRQQMLGIEQAVELGGQRAARKNAAALRRSIAEARLESARALLDFEVARSYAVAVAADRRVSLARQAAAAFTEAGRVSEQRLAAGDISVYADRRLRLEAARYSALEAEAILVRRTARLALSALVSSSADSIGSLQAVLTDSLPGAIPQLAISVLQSAALRNRFDFVAAGAEGEALAAEARLISRERIPTPVLSGGFKTENAAGISESLTGFAAGVSFPLPLWDRRRGAIHAAAADVRRAAAERESLKRRIFREVVESNDALAAIQQQQAALAPQLGAQSAAALRSAQVAYSEGEITLLEWLDAVRAYHEAESAYSNLLAEFLIRRATLEHAIGSPLAAVVATDQPGTMRDVQTLQLENK